MDRCVHCDRQVDTDSDVECYVDGECVCYPCRDAEQDLHDDRRLDDPRRGQANHINRGRW